jgi:hypothetical protein
VAGGLRGWLWRLERTPTGSALRVTAARE